ncbi:MAG TPA: hypothetical protein VHF89_13210 [Solirubrobacteraceae bacterium]|nr:hypothetical protein [Solirubrobacteraceae bacterium]
MRRGVLIGAAALLTVAAVFGVLAFFNARDDSTIGDDAAAPGTAAPSLTERTLAQGNVEIVFSDPAHREALEALASDVAGPKPQDPALVHAGNAVIVSRGDAPEIVATAYQRELRVASPDDPALREFVEYWLGRGAMR